MEPGWKSPSSAICRSRVDLSSTKGGNGSGMGPPRLKVLHTLRFRPQKMKLRDPSLSCRALSSLSSNAVHMALAYTVAMTFRVILEHDPETGDYSAGSEEHTSELQSLRHI